MGGIAASAREWRQLLHTAGFQGKSSEYARQELWGRMTMSNFCGAVAANIKPPPERGLYGYEIDAAELGRLCRAFYRGTDPDGAALLRALEARSGAIPPEARYPKHVRRCFSGLCYRVEA